MKQISYFILLISLLSLSSCNKESSLRVLPNNKFLKYEGRFWFKSDSIVRYDYPGSRITIHFEGTGLRVYLKPNAGYYCYSVDGSEEHKFCSVSINGDNVLTLVENLPLQQHTLSLTLISEGLFVKPEFYGFEIIGGNKISKIEDKCHKMEFIGNSITCAYGVEAHSKEAHFNDSTSNFTKSFASIVANHFKAERMVVARSGIGIYRNYNDSITGSVRPMPLIYNNILISEEKTKWNAEDYKPELICINLGTNDFSTTGANELLFENAYNKFLDNLRFQNPNAKIIILCGCMMNNATGLDKIIPILDKIKEQRNQNGDNQIYRFNFTPQDGSLGYGADWHPSEAQQHKMADELIPFIEEITGWTSVN